MHPAINAGANGIKIFGSAYGAFSGLLLAFSIREANLRDSSIQRIMFRAEVCPRDGGEALTK